MSVKPGPAQTFVSTDLLTFFGAMARIARVVGPDFPHRMQRGVRRMDVFFSADDRQEYLELLSQSASKHTLDFPSRVSDE